MESKPAATLLTKDVLIYQESEYNREVLFNKIYLFVYRYPVDRGYFQEETASDFLLFLIPKLERIIERYSYSGVSFEVYLRKIIYWQIKTFTQQRKDAQLREQIYTKFFYNCFEKISFYDEEPDSFNDVSVSVSECKQTYTKQTTSPYLSLTKSHKGKKKILVIALIHANTIGNSVISGVSSICRIPIEQLNSWILELKDSLDYRYEKVEKLYSQRNSMFFSLLELQTKLKEYTCRNDAYLSVSRKIEHYQNQLKLMHLEVKHAQGKIHYGSVAKILNIPTGTVASTVFYARKLSEK
jgi:hypothetical protein